MMATSTEPSIFYSKKELGQIAKVLRTMSDVAIAESKKRVQEIADKELNAIRAVASGRGKVAQRIADGGKVKKSSLLGEIQFGFASQRFSGGATTQFNTRDDTPGNRKGIGAATEFGSAKYPQFPSKNESSIYKAFGPFVGFPAFPSNLDLLIVKLPPL